MAVTLNGTTQWLENGPDWEIPTTCSISAWVQFADFAGIYEIGGRRDNSNSAGWAFRMPAQNVFITMQFTGGSGNQDFSVAAMSANTWIHVLYVRTSTNQYVYVNGTETAAGSAGTYVNVTPSSPMDVGALAREPSEHGLNSLKGQLAEYAIWDGLDLRSNVGDLRTGSTAGKAPNNIGVAPTYYWKLISDAVATIGGFNLTQTGSPGWDASAHAGLTIDYGSGGAVTLMGQAVF